jgi:hypothetical protein
MRFFASLLLVGVLAGCHSSSDSASRTIDNPAVLTAADFEQSIGWGNADPVSLTTEKAHSGKWSVRVKPNVPYGFTYSRTLGEMSTTPLTRLVLEGWALREAAGSTAKLVVQVDASATDETKVFYVAYPIEQAVPKIGEWTAIQVPISLPVGTAGTSKVKIYLWNDQATAATYIDDLLVRKAE